MGILCGRGFFSGGGGGGCAYYRNFTVCCHVCLFRALVSHWKLCGCFIRIAYFPLTLTWRGKLISYFIHSELLMLLLKQQIAPGISAVGGAGGHHIM